VIDELAARRAAVLARRQKARDDAALERQRNAEPVDHVGAAIAASRRKHPSNPRAYDHQQEENNQ
jgi:hypothetical protein